MQIFKVRSQCRAVPHGAAQCRAAAAPNGTATQCAASGGGRSNLDSAVLCDWEGKRRPPRFGKRAQFSGLRKKGR